MTLFEVNQAAAIIRETAHPDVNMIFGAVIDPEMGDDIRVYRHCDWIRTQRSPAPCPRTPPADREACSCFQYAFLTPGRIRQRQRRDPLLIRCEIRIRPSINADDLDVPTFLRNRR
jgi:cell division protein FtsZ